MLEGSLSLDHTASAGCVCALPGHGVVRPLPGLAYDPDDSSVPCRSPRKGANLLWLQGAALSLPPTLTPALASPFPAGGALSPIHERSGAWDVPEGRHAREENHPDSTQMPLPPGHCPLPLRVQVPHTSATSFLCWKNQLSTFPYFSFIPHQLTFRFSYQLHFIAENILN